MRPEAVLGGAMLLAGMTIFSAHVATDKDNINQVIPHHAGELLVVSFAHADHTEQHCVECHHNFVDDTGVGLCFDCHKSVADIAPLIEQQFHDLCRGCHEQKQLESQAHGPTRSCIACHTSDPHP